MKFYMLFFGFLFTTAVFAQKGNTDNIEKTIITKKIIETNEGKQVQVTKQKVSAQQELVVHGKGVNQKVTYMPAKVTTATIFKSDGVRYVITPDPKGYLIKILKDGEKKQFGKIRKMSRPNSYLLVTDDWTAFGYFNADGDFVTERYDAQKDEIVVDSFDIINKSDLD